MNLTASLAATKVKMAFENARSQVNVLDLYITPIVDLIPS